MSLFPIFAKLDGRAALVVGGGAFAEARIAPLIEARAGIRVVAPKVSEAIERWIAEGSVAWCAREFVPADVADAEIVFAATGRADVDRSVATAARQARVLVNAADDPNFCDFYMPAIVRRGDLQIAISTNGRSPALAQQLRQHLEAEFDAAWSRRLVELGEQRLDIIGATQPGPERLAKLQQLARDAVKELLP